MIFTILETVSNFILLIVRDTGYLGVFLLMFLESMNLPISSEIIMPFSGFLVSEGYFNLYLVALAGAVGCLLGSVLAYWIGYKYGESAVRTLIKKYGKFVLVFEYELDEAEHWFCKYGSAITFSSRLMPVVRTFISLPAGIAKMPFKSFAVYTFTGSLIWSFALAWVGKKLGDNWNTLGGYFHKFDFLIVLIFAGLAFYYVYHKLKKHRKHQRKKMEPQL